MKKCIFLRYLVSQNGLQDEKMTIKQALPDTNLALKFTYRTRIWLSKSLTEQESGHQIFFSSMIFLTGKIYDYFNSV